MEMDTEAPAEPEADTVTLPLSLETPGIHTKADDPLKGSITERDTRSSEDILGVDDINNAKNEIVKDGKGKTLEGDEEDGELATTISDPESELDPTPVARPKDDVDAVDGGVLEPEKFVIEPKELECQFFGSFYNEKQLREPVIDLVTFATPCKVSEIRIIPLGATVEMLDGVALLGSTNPTNFDLEFYYDDLTDPAHATFKEIIKFTYDHKLAIHFSCGTEDTPVITNKVLVRGVYNSITLAVIGHEVKNFPVRTVLEESADPEVVDEDVGFDHRSLSGSEGDGVEFGWNDEDVDRDSYGDEDDSYSQYSDDYELDTDQRRQEETDSHFDSEEADDDVEMKDAFDTSLEDEVLQEVSPSPPVTPSNTERDKLEPSPPSWDQDDRRVGEKDVRVLETEPEKRSPPPLSNEKAESMISEDSLVEDEVAEGSMEVDMEHPSDNAENDTPNSGEKDFVIVEKEEPGIVSAAAVPPLSPHPPSPVIQHVPFHSHLDMEDISDGDISSEEDLDQGATDRDGEQGSTSASTVPKLSQTSVMSTVPTLSEVKTAEVLSEQEFDDDFEDDLEVISDEEIRDESEFEELDIGEDDDNFPDVYGRPYDQESFQIYRPENYRVELYPKTFLRHDNPLKEKLTEALKKYTPATFKTDVLEGWVEMMEEVLPILSAYLRNIPTTKIQATRDTLIFWVKQSFQLEPTTSPESVTRSLRQLKVALKLAFFLCEFDPQTSQNVTQLELDSRSTTVQEKVVQTLLDSRIPAVQCLCAKALEATLNTKIGFESFVAKKCSGTSIFEGMLSSIMEMKLNTLVYGSIGPVFRTVSLIPVLLELAEVDGSPELDLDTVLANLRTTLDSIQDIERGAYTMKRTSSVAVQNVISRYLPGYDARVGFVKLLQETTFLDSCCKLMTNPGLKGHYVLINLLVRIFEALLSWEVGIIYLAQEFPLELLQGLSRADAPHSPGVRFATYFSQCVTVLKCVDVCTKKFQDLSPSESEVVIDALLDTYMLLAYESGRKAITHMFTVGDFIVPLLDCVKFAETLIVEGDRIQDLEKTAIGGYSVDLLVHVIRNADNLSFLSVHGDEICRLYESLRGDFEGYSKLSEVVQFMWPARIGINFTVEGVGEICEQLKKGVDESLLKVKDNWGFPPDMVTYLRILDNLAICSTGRNCFDSLPAGSGSDLFLERIRAGDSIRHKLICVHMNSADILTTLSGILMKITEEYKQPAVHAHTFLYSKGEALTALILPTVRIIRKLLTEMILIRNTNFRDMTLVPILLATYALVDAFPETATALETVAKIKVHVIAGLQTYTIPVMKVGDTSEEELMNSIWTRMMMELISFTMTSPSNFIPGMRILSDLQPLKLPLISTKELSEGTKAHLISLRKLWSAFLHGVTTPLQEMIGILCESTNRELVILVKRVCFQIADLSAASCLVACRGILEPILNSIEADLEENSVNSQGGVTGKSNSITAWVEGSIDRRNIQCSPRTARLLGFLNSLTRKSGILKAGLLQVMKGSSKVDEKLSEFLTLLGSILTSRNQSAPQVKSQGHVMSIFHTLCNPRVNMFCTGNEVKVDTVYLLENSLPPKDAMSLICSSLLTFLSGHHDIPGNVAAFRKIFYTLNILCETEYGFYHLRTTLSKNSGVIHDLILKLRAAELENLDIVGVMESLEVIDGLLSFLRNLITPQGVQVKKGGIESRKTILSKVEFRKLLGWSSPEKMPNHPLVQLCNFFRLYITQEQKAGIPEGNEEQEYLKTYIGEAKEKLDKMLTFLNKVGGEGQEGLAEVILSTPDSLQDQFNYRPIVVPCEFQDSSQRLDYLCQIGHGGEADFEFSTDDLIVRDLLATVRECSKETETEFTSELEKFCNLRRTEEPSTVSVKSKGKEDLHGRGGGQFDIGSQSASQRSTTSTLSSSPRGKPSFTRGGNAGRQGFGRGLMSNRPNFDPFRSRPPNTSRPPSLHVDDFVAMESSSQGSSGSTRGRSGGGGGNEGGYRGGRGRGAPSPLSRPFNTPDRSGRDYRSSQGSSGSTYYTPRNDESNTSRGRTQQRGRGYSSGDRWSNPNEGSNYGRQDERESNYGDRRTFGGGGRGNSYNRDSQRGRSTTPGGSNLSQQQQRWRNNPGKFNR